MTCWFGFVYFTIPERLGDCWAHIITHLQAFLPLITPEYTITPHCRLAATPSWRAVYIQISLHTVTMKESNIYVISVFQRPEVYLTLEQK